MDTETLNELRMKRKTQQRNAVVYSTVLHLKFPFAV
jgi:hypothetical protein